MSRDILVGVGNHAEQIKAAIVIPAHNSAGTVGECVEACLAQDCPAAEIIVVDDGSTDNTAEVARQFSVTVVTQAKRGPAAARNAGARAAVCDVVVFTDADCVPRRDWLAQMLAAMTPDTAAVGGTYGIRNPQSWLARVVQAEIVLRHGAFGERIDFAGSYSLAVLRETFLSVGGFDESFTAASAEDNDLCYRLIDAGYVIAFAKKAVVEHYHPTRLGRYLRAQARHGFWRVKLYVKHPRRGRGDRYAAGLDLWAPLIVLVAVSAFGMSLAAKAFIAAALAWTALLVLAAYRTYAAARLRRAMPVPILRASVALFLRDAARGAGLFAGVLWFILLGKSR